MHTNVYLHFSGDCADAIKFYEKAMGAKTETVMPFSGAPPSGNLPPEWKDKIMHGSIRVGSTSVQVTDAPPGMYARPQGFRVTLNVDSPADADRIFKALAEGGAVQMGIEETFFAHRFGMVTDKFGIPWIVIHNKAM
ncbi:MAG TPA: VOC family protein [Rhizomicrobium sp.]|nr:VOC family protein [Rhizomicrobium sp.]